MLARTARYTILAHLSATEGRVFKQCATKGRVLSFDLQTCAREGMAFPVVVPGRVQNVQNCTKLAEFSARSQ